MQPETTHIFDVTQVADFQERVMRRSTEVPVLVDFWAEWCQPCKTLTPILEKLAAEYEGRFELAKVDVDQSQQIAAAFRIQSIPTVFLFVGGQPVDGFQGAQPEAAIRKILDQHVPPAEQEPLEVAREALAAGRPDVAEQAFQAVLTTEPQQGEALLGLARLALGRSDQAAATAYLDRIPEESSAYDQAQRMRGVFGFAADAGDAAALEAKVAANPGDAESWYRLGATRATQGDMDGACAAFLKVVAADRELREDGGRSALLAIFDVLGPDDPLVGTYRRKLASLLF